MWQGGAADYGPRLIRAAAERAAARRLREGGFARASAGRFSSVLHRSQANRSRIVVHARTSFLAARYEVAWRADRSLAAR